MKTLLPVLLLAAGTTLAAATDPNTVTGDYVEVRTAEVFTGPCMLGSEWESLGREAIMAWRISKGAIDGTSLDGLSVVAVVGADRNLGSQTLGAPPPSQIKTVVMVDERATPAQRRALLTMVRGLAPAMTREVTDVRAVPISFVRQGVDTRVTAAEARLDVTTRFEHSPTCGATQWFDPLASTITAELALTRANAWSGASPGATWTQTDRKSSFVGTFSFSR
jgi:hypothetical protein